MILTTYLGGVPIKVIQGLTTCVEEGNRFEFELLDGVVVSQVVDGLAGGPLGVRGEGQPHCTSCIDNIHCISYPVYNLLRSSKLKCFSSDSTTENKPKNMLASTPSTMYNWKNELE